MSEKAGELYYEVSMDYDQPLADARRFRKDVKDTEKSLDSLNAKFSDVGRAVQGFLGGLAIAATIRKIIEETRNAEQEQTQLAAVLRSTGESAGWSAAQLNDLADQLAKSSTFSGGEIINGINRMLSYENVVGKQVPKAMQATIDMSARLGTSVTQSAEEIGKALNKPSEGMTSLGRKGFEFSADQIALAKKLESTGKVAEAQAIVFEALEFAYGGAAAAARNTFGGALTALQNQLNDLLTGKDGLPEATTAVNNLAETLDSPETQSAFSKVTAWVVDLTGKLADMTTEFVLGLQHSDGFFDAIGKYGLTNPFKSPAEQLASINTELNSARKNLEALEGTGTNVEGRRGALRSQVRSLEQQQQYWQTLADRQARKDIQGPPISAMSRPAPTFTDGAGEKARQAAAEKAARKADQERERQLQKAKEYLKTLDQQASRVDEMTVSQRLQYDLKTGAVVLQGKELEKATELAKTIDAMKKAQEDRVIALNQTNAQLSAERDLLAQIDNYSQNIAGMTMSDRAVQDMQARIQITETYLSRIRDLEAQERQALATNQDSSKEASIRKQYADLIAVQQEYQTKSLAEWEKYVLARNAKEGDWTTGAQKAYANYVESASNASAQAQSLFEKGFQGMEDALVNFAMSGKLNFKDLANSIIADLVRIQIRAAMVGKDGGGGLLGSLFSAGMSMLGGSPKPLISSGTSAGGVDVMNGYSSGGYTGNGGKFEPKGVVHGGEYVINKESTAALGLGFLDKLNGYASGGYVGVANVPTPGAATPVEINMKFVGAPSEPTVQRSRNASGGLDVDVIFRQVDANFADGISNGNSRSYRSLKQRFGLKD